MKKTLQIVIPTLLSAALALCFVGCDNSQPNKPKPDNPPQGGDDAKYSVAITVDGEAVYTGEHTRSEQLTLDLLGEQPQKDGYEPVYFENGEAFSFPHAVTGDAAYHLLRGWSKTGQSGKISLSVPATDTLLSDQRAFWNESDMSRSGLFASYSLSGQQERSHPNKIAVSVTPDAEVVAAAKSYRVIVSDDVSFENVYYSLNTANASVPQIELDNLAPNTVYYAKVQALNASKKVVLSGAGEEVICFATKDAPLYNLHVESVANARDLGGYHTVDGHPLNRGVLLRTGRLNDGNATTCRQIISAAGVDFLVNTVGIKTEIELRGKRDYTNLTDQGKPYSYECGNPNGISVLNNNSSGKSVNWVYAGFTESNFQYEYNMIRAVFASLGAPENYPQLFHCAIGTDRTGMIAFYVLALCNVGTDTIYKDYMFSNFAAIGSTRNVSAINTYLSLVNGRPGDTLCKRTENYLVNVVGVSSGHIQTLREKLLGAEYAATLA